MPDRTRAQRRHEAELGERNREWTALRNAARPEIKIGNVITVAARPEIKIGNVITVVTDSDGRITVKAGRNRIWLDRNESAELVAAIQELTA